MAIGINWAEVWKPVWKAVWTNVAPVPAASGPTPAGRAKARRRVYLEIDGKPVVFDSQQQAAEYLEAVREREERNAQQVVDRAVKASRRAPRKVIADARKALSAPQITAPDYLSGFVAEIQQRIAQIHADALRTVEIEAFLKRKQRESDDEDEELLLLML